MSTLGTWIDLNQTTLPYGYMYAENTAHPGYYDIRVGTLVWSDFQSKIGYLQINPDGPLLTDPIYASHLAEEVAKNPADAHTKWTQINNSWIPQTDPRAGKSPPPPPPPISWGRSTRQSGLIGGTSGNIALITPHKWYVPRTNGMYTNPAAWPTEVPPLGANITWALTPGQGDGGGEPIDPVLYASLRMMPLPNFSSQIEEQINSSAAATTKKPDGSIIFNIIWFFTPDTGGKGFEVPWPGEDFVIDKQSGVIIGILGSTRGRLAANDGKLYNFFYFRTDEKGILSSTLNAQDSPLPKTTAVLLQGEQPIPPGTTTLYNQYRYGTVWGDPKDDPMDIDLDIPVIALSFVSMYLAWEAIKQ